MLIDCIKLGIKDIIRNWKEFCIFLLLSIVSVTVITASVSSAYRLLQNGDVSEASSYWIVPVSMDMNLQQYTPALEDIFLRGGSTWFYSEKVNQEFDMTIVVLFGKYEMHSEETVFWLVPENTDLSPFSEMLGSLRIVPSDAYNDRLISMTGLSNAIADSNMKMITFSPDIYHNLQDYMPSSEDVELIVENTKFTEEDLNQGLDLEFENLFSGSSIYLKKTQPAAAEELRFLKQFMIVYDCMLLLVGFFAFSLFILRFYEKTRKEYRIHLICGGSIGKVLARNLMYIIVWFLISFGAFYALNGFRLEKICCCTLMLQGIFSCGLMYGMLKKERLNENLYGE